MKLTKKLSDLLREKPDALCKIWSGEHGAWWNANAKGYTADCAKAGIYTITDAHNRVQYAGKEKGIKIVPMQIIEIKVAQNYLSHHPKAGQPTNFEQAILSGTKIHTIRADYEAWAKKAEKINAGFAYLSLRKWSGLPYKSKTVEIKRLFRVGVRRFNVISGLLGNRINIPREVEYNFFLSRVAKNDGFSNLQDFKDWFKPFHNFEGAIIHFTDFRY